MILYLSVSRHIYICIYNRNLLLDRCRSQANFMENWKKSVFIYLRRRNIFGSILFKASIIKKNKKQKKMFVFDEMSSRCCLWLNLKGLRTQNCARKWSISCKWTTLARFLFTKYIVYKLYIHLLYPQGVT